LLFNDYIVIIEYGAVGTISEAYFTCFEALSYKAGGYLWFFAKDNANSDSDVDLLIEPTSGFTIFKMLKLEDEISDLIKRKVDLVEYTALKPSIRKEVLSSAINIL